MKKLKKFIINILIITLAIFLAIVGFFTLPWIAIYIGVQLSPAPPRPEIIYSKFPFRLEYEINDKRVVIKDTVICEYDGVLVVMKEMVNTTNGKNIWQVEMNV